MIVAFVAGLHWSWYLMLAAAVGSLWYPPFGKLLGLIQILLLLLPSVRDPA